MSRQTDDSILQFLLSLNNHGEKLTKIQYGADYGSFMNQIEKTLSSKPLTTISRANSQQKSFSVNVLPIAAVCNLNCPYCFAQTDGGFHFESYNNDSIKATVDFLAKNRHKLKKICIAFFGGEPLIKFDLIKYCVEYADKTYPGLFVYSITTNGTLVNDEIADFFHKHKFSVLVSVDGQDNEFNLRKFHNGNKSIDKVLQNLNRLIDKRVDVKLRATMVNTNPYICSTFAFFEKLKIPFTIVFAYSSENTSHQYARYDSSILAGIESQLHELLAYYTTKISAHEIIYNTKFGNLLNQLKYRTTKNLSCSAGRTYFTIMSNGDIFSCPHFMNNKDRVIGNIHNEVLFDETKRLTNSPELVAKHKSCKKCWARTLCLGGCASQKIISGRTNTCSYSKEECELAKLEFSLYINLCYCAFKYSYGKEK